MGEVIQGSRIAGDKRTIQVDNKELWRRRIEISDGKYGDLVAYDIPGYGYAECVENVSIESGEYRKTRSMIPGKYASMTSRQFNWSIYDEKYDLSEVKKIVNSFVLNYSYFARYGKGMYIYSRTKGSGKTMLACCICNEVVEHQDISIKFISAPELIEISGRSYSDTAVKSRINELYNCDVLILDDIGAEQKKEWSESVLFRIIDYRYSGKKITIFTSNYEINRLNTDYRIIDRINEMTLTIHLPEVCVRSILTDKENQIFLQGMRRK